MEISIRDLAVQIAGITGVFGADRLGCHAAQRAAAPVSGRKPGGAGIRVPGADGVRRWVEEDD